MARSKIIGEPCIVLLVFIVALTFNYAMLRVSWHFKKVSEYKLKALEILTKQKLYKWIRRLELPETWLKHFAYISISFSAIKLIILIYLF